MDSDPIPYKGKAIAIIGPTATGKTRRAVELARALGGEIISCDSRQVYKGMDLGTGKDINEYGDIAYHLIDVCEAGEKYNLYRFLADYGKVRDDIRARGRIPVLCGGSGMYMEAALNGMVMPEVPRNETLRKKLEGKSLDELTEMLSSMKRLHNVTDVDTVARALRAIEIQQYYLEHPSSVPVKDQKKEDALVIGIDIPRDERRSNISRRLRKRLDDGMIDEVRRLLESGVTPDNLIYYGLEYKWLTLHVLGKISFDEMLQQLEIAIYQFAKRQMTWFRGMERRGHIINWVPFDIPTEDLISKTKEWMRA